jgi:hypothetical protein
MKSQFVPEAGLSPLTAGERTRFESYMAEIFGRLGMDLGSES